MRLRRLCFSLVFVCVASFSQAASIDDRVQSLFQSPVAETMALSPDGQRVAYTVRKDGELSIVMMHLDYPGAKRTVKVDADRDAISGVGQPSTHLRFLRWATPSRLVFAPAERIIPLPPVADPNGRLMPNPDGPTIVSPIFAVDADGRQRGVLVDARDFQDTPADARRTLADLLRTTKELVATRDEPVHWRMPHLDILGFLPRDRDQLVFQTRGGYSPPAQHLVDIRTGSVREFGGNWARPPEEPQVFDWHLQKVVGERKLAARPTTAWQDVELGRLQRELEVKFPRRVVELTDWSETRSRVLFRVTGGRDPGRVFVLQRPEDLVLEILRHAPGLEAAKLNDTRFFEFDTPDHARLSGYLTWPNQPRLEPPPLLVVFPSGFPGAAQPAFDPEAQIFADFGFAVARLNHRSVGGVRAEDLHALRTAVDRLAVDDARAAVEWLARNLGQPFDRERVGSLGRGFGGYLAVRALQLQPNLFKCGVAIDAPLDLRPWLRNQETGGLVAAAVPAREIPATLIDHPGADWRKLSVLEQAEALKHPVLLLVEPARNAAVDTSTAELRARLQSLGRRPEHFELDPGFAAALPTSRASVYRKIEAFLNLHLAQELVRIELRTEGE